MAEQDENQAAGKTAEVSAEDRYVKNVLWQRKTVMDALAAGKAACIFIKNKGENIFGTARWAKKKDLKKAGLLGDKGGVILGQTAEAKLKYGWNPKFDSVTLNLKSAASKITVSGLYNTLLAAPTRSGKGVSNVIPTLLSYPGSVIVLDFKGENFDLTSGFRKRFGKVYRWAPVGEGHHFNPMMEIRPGDDAFNDANLIADILTTPASKNGKAGIRAVADGEAEPDEYTQVKQPGDRVREGLPGTGNRRTYGRRA